MSRYPALIRVNDDASYDVTFPDLPAVTVAGPSLEDAMEAAQTALQAHLDANADAAEPFASGEPDATGAMLALIEGAHASDAPKMVDVSLSLDARMLARIDAFREAQGFATRDLFFNFAVQNVLQRPARQPRAEGGDRDYKPRAPKREDYATREPRASSNYFRNDGGKKGSDSFRPRRDDAEMRNPRRARPEAEDGEERPRRPYRPREEAGSDRPRREYKPRDEAGGDRPRREYKPRGEAGEDRPRRAYASRDEAGGDRPKKAFGERKSFGDKKPFGDKKKSFGDKKPFGAKKPFGKPGGGSKKPPAGKTYGSRGPSR